MYNYKDDKKWCEFYIKWFLYVNPTKTKEDAIDTINVNYNSGINLYSANMEGYIEYLKYMRNNIITTILRDN